MRLKFLFYIVLIFFCCIQTDVSASHRPLAKEGVIDLRNEDFSEPIDLDGEWFFYWKQLLEPKDVATGKFEVVNLPGIWTGQELNGKKFPSYGYATYTLTVLLPKHTPLRLVMPDIYSSYRCFINGKEIAANGRVSTSENDFIPYWQYKGVNIGPKADSLSIVLQVANFSHSKGGMKKAITIGKADEVILARHRDMAIDFMLTGCLFMGGLFFLGLYLLGNRDNSILYFSLFSMAYSYRTVGVDTYVLHTILPNISWYITIRIEYITLFLGVCFFARYSLHLYPQVVNKKIIDGISIICFSFVAAVILLPSLYFTRLIYPFLLVTSFCLIYTPYIYIKAWLRKLPGSALSVVSSLALMSVFLVSFLHYWAHTPAFHLFTFGAYITFFFLQSLILSHRVSFVLNNAIQQANQGLVAKSDFLSTMSHEIRTPLNSVIGMSHLLLKSDPRDDQAEKLEVMLFSANNLLAIVNDVLDYNKIEAGKVTFEHIEMDVASIARNIVKGLQTSAQDKGIELKLDLDNSLRNKLLGDPTRVYQVLNNLVHNAIKFTQTGYVQVGICVIDQKDQSATLRFEVKDTGIGISADKQKVIFERFTQADSSTSRGFGGTGLGLAIAKRILELQNSELQLESEEGRGSVFFFVQTFEKSNKTVEQKKLESKLPQEEDKPLSGISILLVEDNAMNVMVAQSFLARWGASIDVAVNGQEALDKLDTARHRLVLMDLHMPVMDGFEATKRMRANGVSIPIVALTADLPKEIEEEIKETGIDDIVVKPFLPDELYRKVLHHVFKRDKLVNSDIIQR